MSRMMRTLSLVAGVWFAWVTAQPGTNNLLIDFNEYGDPKVTNDVNLRNFYNKFWRARLNPSSDYLENRRLTYVENVSVKKARDGRFGYSNDGYALGVRCNFPSINANSAVTVRPVYEFEAYPTNAQGDYTNTFESKGVLHNIGLIKSITTFVKGKNFPHALYLNLRDENDQVKAYFMGYLNFDGWQEKIYANPGYLTEVKDRALIRVPNYPKVEPIVKFDSFQLFRNAEHIDGDFVAYFGWVRIVYDRAIHDENDDINDEDVWKIRRTQSRGKAEAENERLKSQGELERLERIKMFLPPSPYQAQPR